MDGLEFIGQFGTATVPSNPEATNRSQNSAVGNSITTVTMPKGQVILVLGYEGAGHAVAKALARSDDVKTIWVYPGNLGTNTRSEGFPKVDKIHNYPLSFSMADSTGATVVREVKINLVVVLGESWSARVLESSARGVSW
jgi:hypothetical protein